MRAIDPRLLRRARSSSGFLLVCVVIGLAIAACVFGQAVTLAMGISRVFLGGADFHGAVISAGDRGGEGNCSREIATATRPDVPRR